MKNKIKIIIAFTLLVASLIFFVVTLFQGDSPINEPVEVITDADYVTNTSAVLDVESFYAKWFEFAGGTIKYKIGADEVRRMTTDELTNFATLLTIYNTVSPGVMHPDLCDALHEKLLPRWLINTGKPQNQKKKEVNNG